MQEDNRSFIECFREGDQRAISILVKFLYPELIKFSIKITGSKYDAEEIIQDAFVLVWQKRSGFDDILSIRKFLFIVVKNKSIDVAFKTKRGREILNNYTYLLKGETEIDEIENGGILGSYDMQSEISTLSARSKTILSLILIGKSIKEIAGLLNLTEKTIRNTKQKAISVLRERRPRNTA